MADQPKTTDLLPCPFCGGPASANAILFKGEIFHMIGCIRYGCAGQPWHVTNFPDRAIAAWNRRTPPGGN